MTVYVATDQATNIYDMTRQEARQFLTTLAQWSPAAKVIFPVDNGEVAEHGLAVANYTAPYYAEWLLVVNL